MSIFYYVMRDSCTSKLSVSYMIVFLLVFAVYGSGNRIILFLYCNSTAWLLSLYFWECDVPFNWSWLTSCLFNLQVDVVPLKDVPKAIADYHMCIVKNMRLDSSVISQAAKMKLIMQFGMGLEGTMCLASIDFLKWGVLEIL